MKVTSLLVAPLALGLAAGAMAAPAAAQPSAPQVRINEVMVDPDQVYDSRGEWIELVNTGAMPVDLAGWTIGDEVYDQIVLPTLVIGPGEHLVLGRDGDPFVNGGAHLDFVYGNGIVLANREDSLILRDASTTMIDTVVWGPNPSAPTGASLARVGPQAQWCPSVTVMDRGDLGTPGGPNRCEPSGDSLVITEIMQNPSATSDAQGEWFEVYNAGDVAVDMQGYTVKDDDGDRFSITEPMVVAARGYAVLARQGAGNGGVAADYVFGDAMALQNDVDEIVLADRDLVQVDRVQWDNGATFPDPDGASMSLRDVGLDNSLGSSWCTATRPWATADRGSPGAESWCLDPGHPPIVINEIMADPERPPGERAAEWFEVMNISEDAVDLSGWTVTAGDYATHTITALTIAGGELAVLAASGDRTRNGDITPSYVYGTQLPLYNAAGRIILQASDGTVVDRVDWSATGGFPSVPGRSMALLAPTADNSLGANWCPSPLAFGAGDFGSPGLGNSCEPPPPPPPVVISEVLRNPAAVDDSFGEWFEVHNPSGAPVDLRGWVLTDGASDRHLIRRSVLVPAGGYAVLGRTQDRSQNGDVAVDYAYGDGFVLSNDVDSIALSDRFGRRVDSRSWSLNDRPRPNGASLALVDGTWCESGPQFGRGDRGTPGAPNDCTPLPHVNVVINEVHVDPLAISDTVGEWIEILNAGPTPVDLNGWVLRDDDYDEHRIDAGRPLMIAPGAMVVLGRDVAGLNGGASVDYVYGSALPLVEPADEINLYDASLVPVDRVAWTASQALPYAPGASAARRTPAPNGSAPAGWCTSVTAYGGLGERGTPGRPNVCEVPPAAAPGFAIFATSTAANAWSGLTISGSQVTIAGNVRSNSSVSMSGASIKVGGTISSATPAKLSKKVSHGGLILDRAPTLVALPWALADFAPGGRFSTEVGYRPSDRSLVIGRSGLPAGIYYVRGNVTVSGSAPDLVGVTIVATGSITISGGSDLSPAAAGMPTLLAGGGIKLAGSSLSWSGLIATPGGEIAISGSNISGGQLVGRSVKISGSRVAVGG